MTVCLLGASKFLSKNLQVLIVVNLLIILLARFGFSNLMVLGGRFWNLFLSNTGKVLTTMIIGIDMPALVSVEVRIDS